MKTTRFLLALTISFLTFSAFPMAQWDNNNRPELMENKYERNFSKLPKSAKLKTLPWSDDYWGTYKGGISYRWNQKVTGTDESARWSYKIIEDINKINVSINELSPAEKYDLFLGNMDFPLTTYEKKRTQIMKTVPGEPDYDKDFKIPEWEGICHGWAPATLEFGNSEPITVTGKNGQKISFGSSDMHALLSYHLHLNKSSKTGFLGSRCSLDFKELKKKLEKREITKKELEEKMNSAECADTNAGAFHVALTNQIGLMNQGFVADVTRDTEVWNQPIYSFESKILGTSNRATPGAAPGTVKEITVYTKMGYVGEIQQTFKLVTKPFYIKYEEYEYRLELNADGEIVGGEWISEDRPDFIWKSAPVPFKGYFKELEGLYKKSTRYLNPTLYTDEIKQKIKKAGRLSLIEREFIKDANTAANMTKLREGTINVMVKHIAVDGFKAAGAKAKAERIAANVADLKQDLKTRFLAKKFIKDANTAANMTNLREGTINVMVKHLAVEGFKAAGAKEKAERIASNVAELKKDVKTNFLASKFIKEVKGEVRDTHIKAAILDAKKAVKPEALQRVFIAEVNKDAKATRLLKEKHKKAAKTEVRVEAAGKFLANKFVTEVSKDAKETRARMEANKAKAIVDAKKFAVRSFYSKKFITDVNDLVSKNPKVQERRKLEAQKKLDQSLMEAAGLGNLTKFQELVKQGANIAYSDDAGITPLMIAVQKEQKTIIAALLKTLDQKAINAVDKQGKNALIWAITAPSQRPDRDTRSIVRDLLEKNIEVNQRDSSGKTALGYVTSGENKSKLIQWALKEKGAKV